MADRFRQWHGGLVDPTLTREGVPADAKAAGEIIDNVKKSIKEIQDSGISSEYIDEAITEYLNNNPIEGVTRQQLTEAVEAALQAAKDSGEFDGKDGEDGAPGIDGVPGEDGKDGEPGVIVSETEPTDPNINVWIKPDGGLDENGTIVDFGPVNSKIDQVNYAKANVIMDTSPKAASHELHVQDGRLAVTLYGNTTETGSGDKSPDNPYTIRGVDVAKVHVGGKNILHDVPVDYTNVCTVNADGSITVKTSSEVYPSTAWMVLPAGTYTISAEITDSTGVSRVFWQIGSTSDYSRVLTASVKSITYKLSTPTKMRVIHFTKADTATFKVQLEVGSTATAYEPYTANVINAPLLPDGAPLMGNGTAMDTVENDVLSGCDKCVVFDGSDDEAWVHQGSGTFFIKIQAGLSSTTDVQRTNYIPFASEHPSANSRFKITEEGLYVVTSGEYTTVSGIKEMLSERPLTVYYRSNEYTPEKDLMVCKVTRNWKTLIITGEEKGNVYSWNEYTGFGIENALPENLTRASGYSNCYTVGTAASPGAGGASYITWIGVSGKTLYVLYKNNPFSSYADFRAYASEKYASGNPIAFYFPVSNAETYYTDPLTLSKPEGITPVTVTGSGETVVTYNRDTKDFGKSAATSMIGATENGMVATKNYAIGDFIVNKESLTMYRATKAIAKGETINPSTNCTATTVVEQLAAIYTLLKA